MAEAVAGGPAVAPGKVISGAGAETRAGAGAGAGGTAMAMARAVDRGRLTGNVRHLAAATALGRAVSAPSRRALSAVPQTQRDEELTLTIGASRPPTAGSGTTLHRAGSWDTS